MGSMGSLCLGTQPKTCIKWEGQWACIVWSFSLKCPSVLSDISVRCLPLKLCSYLEKLDIAWNDLWMFSYCLWPAYIFISFSAYIFPVSALYLSIRKTNIEIYLLYSHANNIFQLSNVYVIRLGLFSFFFYPHPRTCIFIFERGEGREREKERNINVKETSIGCLW